MVVVALIVLMHSTVPTLRKLQTNHAYLQTILLKDQNHIIKLNLAGIIQSTIPGFMLPATQ